MLYVVAGLEILAMVPIALLPGKEHQIVDHRPALSGGVLDSLRVDYETVEVPSGVADAVRTPRVRRIAILVALGVVVATMIEFQWKSSVAVSYAAKENEMTGFFGLFYAATNLITGTTQILLTGKILHHFGSRTALLMFPAALLVSTLGVLFSSWDRVLLPAATLAKGCDVIKRSVNDPSIWMLYAPLQNGPRRQAITVVSGIIKPTAEAVAALLIICCAGIIGTRAISYVALALLCVWIFVARRHSTSESLDEPPLSEPA